MKILSKILSVVLAISGLMPAMAVLFSYTDQTKVMELFHLQAATTPELQLVIVMMGAALIFAALIQFIAAAWVWNGKEAGFILARWIGIMLLAAAVYIFAATSKLGVNDPSLYAVDLVKSLLILVLSFVVRKKARNLERQK